MNDPLAMSVVKRPHIESSLWSCCVIIPLTFFLLSFEKMFRKATKATANDDALKKKVDELEKQVASLMEWKTEVSKTLHSLGFGAPTEKKELTKQLSAKPPLWFCSYCWVNSKTAYEAKLVDKVSGDADPRQIWDFLQQNHYPGWLDVEYLGGAGLFDDIAEGLMNVKVMVAFVSDEYVASENCQAEFMFARKSLRIPIVPVVVGTGFKWQRSKVGLLLSDALYIDMTNPGKISEKLEELKHRLQQLVEDDKVYLQQTGQVNSLDEVKVGDAVEKHANDPLNFDVSFQKSPIKDPQDGTHLYAWYWWPCEVIEVNAAGDYKLHYWGYDDVWDCWVSKAERQEQIRPMQYPSVNVGKLNPGDRVEVRLFQDTKIADVNAGKAYCWVQGSIISADDLTAKVKLDLDIGRMAGGARPPMDEGCTNKFQGTIPGFSFTGFESVNVTVASIRRI